MQMSIFLHIHSLYKKNSCAKNQWWSSQKAYWTDTWLIVILKSIVRDAKRG